MKDPTRAELIGYLESIYDYVTGGEELHTEAEAEEDEHDGCGCRFDVESAAYYLANDYHGGQDSNLYSLVSTSPYHPGPSEMGIEDTENETAMVLYEMGAEWIEGRE